MALQDPRGKLDGVTLRRHGVGLIARDEARAGEGFTLVAPQTGGGRVHLVAIDGSIAHSWAMDRRPGRHAVILANGNMGYNGYLAGPESRYPLWDLWHGGSFEEVRPDGEVVWSFADPDHHHDGQWLPNGNILYTACRPMPAEAAARVIGGYADDALPDGVIWGDVVREVNRAGELVWEWRSWEHLDPARFPIASIFNRHHWPMINGVQLTRDGLVLMSLRTTSGVIGVDRAGDVRLHIGPDVVSHQHTPVEMDDGTILIFDNGNLRRGASTPFSRIVQVDPATKAVTWSYSDQLVVSFFSAYMGSAQRLPNGNTHIAESATGRLFDVTPDGDVVWEYVIPWFGAYGAEDGGIVSPGLQNSVFRSYRYQPEQLPWLR